MLTLQQNVAARCECAYDARDLCYVAAHKDLAFNGAIRVRSFDNCKVLLRSPAESLVRAPPMREGVVAGN